MGFNPINGRGGGKGGTRITPAKASITGCRLGPQFILTDNIRKSIITKSRQFYGQRPLNVAQALPINREAMDGLDNDDIAYAVSSQVSLIKRVLSDFEGQGHVLRHAVNITELRGLFKGMSAVEAEEEDKECMQHVLSSMMLTYMSNHRVSLRGFFQAVESQEENKALDGGPLIFELKETPRFLDLVKMVSVEGKFSVYFEKMSRRCFIMWDNRQREIIGFDIPFFAKHAGWEPRRFSLFAKLDVLDQMKQSAPNDNHINACRDRELAHFFSFGSKGIYHYNLIGPGVPKIEVDKTAEFVRWEIISDLVGRPLRLEDRIDTVIL